MKTTEEILQQSTKAQSFLGKDYEVYALAGDASSRQYFRILHHNRQTCIWMLLPEGGITSPADEYSASQTTPSTLPFVDIYELLKSKEVRVPEIYVEDVNHQTLLLEDFGDELLLVKVQKNGSKAFEPALKLLSQIAHDHPNAKKDSIAWKRSFDEKLYLWEFDHFVEYGLEKSISCAKTDIAKIKDHFYQITQMYLSYPKHLTHRDFHSRNILSISNQELGVIDFQDALLGPVYYDLVSLLKDAYVCTSRKEQERLALLYKNLLSPDTEDAKLSNDEFLFRFDLMSLHRNLKAAGRFIYIDKVKDNPAYLKDVPQALSYTLETLDLHPELRKLGKLLKPYLENLMSEV